MKKRITSLMLVLSIIASLITAMPMSASATFWFEYGNFWCEVSDDKATVSAINTSISGAIEIPKKIPDPYYDDVYYPVTKISGFAFYGCNYIKSITIPNSVTSIDQFAFLDCSSLKEVKIPSNVTYIGNCAFANCSSLRTVTIPSGIDAIGSCIFEGCSNLTSVVIPKSVIYIGNSAFSDCNSLTDVFYTGSEAEWKIIDIEYHNWRLTDATIHYNYDNLAGLFSKSSYEYNHDLARKSFEFVEAGFSPTSNFTANGNDTSPEAKARYSKIKNKYDEYDFTNKQKFCNYGITLTSTSDKAAYSMASKNITISGETKKIVVLVVRGQGYGGEWVSNFNVGSDATYSQGFKKPADDIISKLKSYISAYKSDDVVLWITGYSRGAAIANLVAASMVDYSAKCSYLDADRIFAYTFATPNPAHREKANTGNPKYNNIFNIVNPADPVPQVLLSSWGYSKFGITKTIMSGAPTAVKKYYKNTTGHTYSISQDQRTAVSNIVNLLGNLADTKAEFNKKYATPIKDIVHWFMVDKKVNENATLKDYALTKYDANDVIRCYQYASADVDAFKKLLKKAGITDEYLSLAKDVGMVLELNGISVDKFLDDLTGNNALSLLKSVFKIISTVSSLDGQYTGLGAVHKPETYEAWLFGLDDPEKIYHMHTSQSAGELLETNANKYKRQLIQCPVDVEVTDKEGNVVVSVVNHEVLIDELPVVVIDDKVIVYYYNNFDDYDVKITAYEDGVVNYYVSEYANGNEETKRVCYNDIEVSANDTLTGNMNDEIDTEIENYNLTLSENVIENTEILDDANLENLSVTVTEEGSGNSTEVVNASKGDYVTLTATPYVGAEFIGWYEGENLLSVENAYSFVIENNISLISKFTVTDAELSAITTPKTENSQILTEATVTANNDIVGILSWKAYCDEILVAEEKTNVSMTTGESKTFTSQFAEDYKINKITVCLYDQNGTAKTSELYDSVLRELPVGENDEYGFVIYPDNKIMITEIKTTVEDSFEIPETIGDYEVFALGAGIFKGNTALKELTLPASITQIETSAFEGCDNLEWLNFIGSAEEWSCVTLYGSTTLPQSVSVATSYADNTASIHSVDFILDDETSAAYIHMNYLKEDARVFAAIYDNNHRLVSVDMKQAYKKDFIVPFSLSADYDSKNNYVKVFCRDLQTSMIPLCNSPEIH